ncbi:hypothetical protein [Yoonia litorea]|nr:hypothetical protein [Yoonia litorea]
MFQSRFLLLGVLFALAILAVSLFTRPETRVALTTSVPQTASTTVVDDGAILAVGENHSPVFGLPDALFRPVDHRKATQAVPDVDRIYAEFDVPVIGQLQASPASSVCTTRLTASRAPVAMVDLTVRSPCFPDTTFLIRHGPASFTVWTGAQGLATVTVPALAQRSRFSVYRQNIQYDEVEIYVPAARNYDRIALNWNTPERLDLHAFEGAAFIGGPGHIWVGSSNRASDAASGESGYTVALGGEATEPPAQMEVYTFPAGHRAYDQSVSIRIGILLDHENCGREIDFTVIEAFGGNFPIATEASPKMPACDQVGLVVLLADDVPTLIAGAG